MNEKQQEREKRFDEKFVFNIENRTVTGRDKKIKSFIQSEIDLALAEERKRIVEMIRKLDEERHESGSYDYQSYVLGSQHMVNKILHFLKDPVEGKQVNKK